MTSLRASGVRRLNALFHQARESVFLLDPQGRFLYVNRAWEELTGHQAESVLGRSTGPGGSDGSNGDELEFLPPAEALAGHACSAASLIVRKDGERLWRRIEFWPYHDGEAKLLGLVGHIREIEAPPLAPEAESQRGRAEWIEARESLRLRYGVDSLVGRGPRHERLLQQITAASSSRAPVLIVGEPGTGKHRVARVLHQRGTSPDGPLLPLDVSALPPEILDRELFSPEAVPTSRFLSPENVTILLGDVVELPRDIQARLASALRGPGPRLIATTRFDPDLAANDDRLRGDLYFALTVLVLRLSPLRERADEIPLLAQHFLEAANRRASRRRSVFHREALDALAAYDWPGNLRELARVVEAAHGRGESDQIAVEDLPADIRGELASAHLPPSPPPAITPLDLWLTQLERRLIEQALARARHNKSRAAELLDISRPRLYRRIKELNIPDEGEPADEGPADPR